MERFTFARFSNEKDKEIRNKRIEKSNTKSDLYWLQSNSDKVIELHRKTYDIQLSNFISKQKESYEVSGIKYKLKLDEFNGILKKIDIYPKPKCNCQGNLIYIDRFNLISCDNYKDINFNHFKMYKPVSYNTFELEKCVEDFEISKNYLSLITRQLPVKIKASDLYEFLILNNVKLHRDDIDRDYFQVGKVNGDISRKREDLINAILSGRFEKVWKQLPITYQNSNENFIRFAIPDFIVTNNGRVHLFEQKKTIDNLDLSQIDLYVSLLKKIGKDVDVFIIVEQEIEYKYQSPYKILTLNELKTYEFN
jgi:hypothetical protein